MKRRPNKCFEGDHFHYKHDGFYNRNASFESSGTEICVREKQIVIQQNCLLQFCLLVKSAIEQKFRFNFFRVSVNPV